MTIAEGAFVVAATVAARLGTSRILRVGLESEPRWGRPDMSHFRGREGRALSTVARSETAGSTHCGDDEVGRSLVGVEPDVGAAAGRLVLVVDDGFTSDSVLAANIEALHEASPLRLVAALPRRLRLGAHRPGRTARRGAEEEPRPLAVPFSG